MEPKEEIIKLLKKEKIKDINLTTPPNPELGDFAFPCFMLAKKKKQNPVELAKELSQKIKPAGIIKRIDQAGPFLNFFVDKQKIASRLIPEILKKGNGKVKKKETYLIEYFHANTHKGMHIGHIRNISMAESLCRILEKDGYKVIRTNYQGDIGPHVAKCIWGYLNLGKKEPKDGKGTWLGKLYSLANKKAAEDEKVTEEIRDINNKLYTKDKKLMKTWEKTKKYCIDDFNKFYKEFDVNFDRFYFESEAEEPGKKIVQDMLKKGLAEENEGAVIINLEKYDMGVYVLLTKDGNALYSTKDLGLAKLKEKEFKFDKSIHITGSEQILHFKQLFKTLGIIGSPMSKRSMHIPYGLVMLPEGKMSSRAGTIVLFDELKEKLFNAAEKAIKERHKGLSSKEVDKRTRQIAYAALKFSMINRENNKDIVFDWERALEFEGETGPYIQYVHARICSIIKKTGEFNGKFDSKLLKTSHEEKLISLLFDFPSVVSQAASSYKPHLVARYLIDLSQAFNEFYLYCPISKANESLKQARLGLVTALKEVVKTGLELLGIEAPEEM